MDNFFNNITYLDIILLFFTLCSAIFIIYNRNLLASIIALSACSLTITTIYILLDAPDVAITEAAVGACVSTIIFLAALSHINLSNLSKSSKLFSTRLYITLSLGLGLLFVLINLILNLPNYGEQNILINSQVTKHYIEFSGIEIGIPEIVTSILASYRGYDTLGETMVIFTAAISVLILLSKKDTLDHAN